MFLRLEIPILCLLNLFAVVQGQLGRSCDNPSVCTVPVSSCFHRPLPSNAPLDEVNYACNCLDNRRIGYACNVDAPSGHRDFQTCYGNDCRTGFFMSEGYPGPYPDRWSAIYLLFIPGATRIDFEFTGEGGFDVESSKDELFIGPGLEFNDDDLRQVRLNNSVTLPDSLVRLFDNRSLSGGVYPPPFAMATDSVWIFFQTNRNIRRNGWKLFWNSTVDLTPPTVIGCPSNITEFSSLGMGSSLSVSWDPEPFANDVSPPVTTMASHSPGQLFVIGTTTVTYTFEDRFENVATCSFDVNVVEVDLTPPTVIGCPSNITELLSLGMGSSLSVTWDPEPFGNDESPPVTSMASHSPGRLFVIGTTTVTYTFEDRFENVATCSFDVNVEDFQTADERLSNFTTVLSGKNVTSEEIQMAADFIQKLTREEEFMTEDDNRVQLVALSLECIANAENPSLEITEPVVETVNNLMRYNKGAYQTTDVNSGRIISALEQQISNFQTADGNYTDVLQNIGVSAIKINPNSVERNLNFANIFLENRTVILGSDIRDGETQVFYNEADIPQIQTVTSISVPASVLGSLTNGMSGVSKTLEKTVVPVSFFLYGNSNLFIPSKPLGQVHVESGSNATVTEIISSQIISARIEDESVLSTGFSSDSHVITKFITNLTLDFDEVIQAEDCVFWLYDERTREGFWSNDGCNKMPDELDLTVCSCDRLGSFAVLVRVRKGDFNASVPLYYITLIGSIVSGICLIFCIITFLSLRQLRSKQPTHIHINLCISLFGFYMAFLLSLLAVQDPFFCALSSAAIHFFCLATVAWMSAEAINMYFLFVKMKRKALRYFIPVACVLCYAVLVGLLDQNSQYETSTYCFIHPGFALYFGFLAEIAILFVFNFVIFSMVIRKMLCRPLMASRTRENARRNEIITRLRHGVLFWFVLGLSWIFGFLAAVEPKTLTFDYLYCIFISLQGLIMFILLCVANPEFRKHFHCKKPKSFTSISAKSTSSTGLNGESQSHLAMSDINT